MLLFLPREGKSRCEKARTAVEDEQRAEGETEPSEEREERGRREAEKGSEEICFPCR